MKYFCLFVLLLIFIYGCDPITYFDVNDKKRYNLSCDCGELEISASVMLSNFMIVLKTKSGSFLINMDSLKSSIIPNELSNTLIFNDERGVGITNSDIILVKGKAIHIRFFPQKEQNILILPNNYIMCNNEPLITDTIRISLK